MNRFRHTVEDFAPVNGKKLAPFPSALRKLQQVLGESNDYRAVLALACVVENRRFVAWLAEAGHWLEYLGTS